MFLASTLGVVAATVIAFLALTLILVALLSLISISILSAFNSVTNCLSHVFYNNRKIN